MGRPRTITEEGLAYIKNALKTKSINDIAIELHCSYTVAYNVCRSLGKKKNHTYTQQEDKYIIDNYRKVKASTIANELGVPVGKVYNRAKKLFNK